MFGGSVLVATLPAKSVRWNNCHQSNDKPDELVMIEHWKSGELLDKHFNNQSAAAAVHTCHPF
jgi:quinol monooxygenase YgiN